MTKEYAPINPPEKTFFCENCNAKLSPMDDNWAHVIIYDYEKTLCSRCIEEEREELLDEINRLFSNLMKNSDRSVENWNEVITISIELRDRLEDYEELVSFFIDRGHHV